MILLLVLSATSAMTYSIGKLLLAVTTPIFLNSIRFFIAGTIFLFYYWSTHDGWPRLYKHDYWVIAQNSFFSFFIGFTLEFWGLQYMTSVKTAFLYSLSPVVAALLSYLVFHEKMTIKKALGLIIAFLGFLPILMVSAPKEEGCGGIFFLSWPELALLGAVFSYCYGWTVMRKALRHHKMPSSFVNGISMILGGCASLITSIIAEMIIAPNPAWITPWLPITNLTTFILLTGILILTGNVLSYMLYAYLLKRYTATLLTFGELATPVFAAFYGWLLLSEPVQWYFYFSMVVLLIGMYIFYQEEKRQGYIDL